MFPAGEVSHIRLRHLDIADRQWNTMATRLASLTGATTLPVYLPGCNSPAFQALSFIHPQLRTAWLLNEFLQQTDRTVEVRIGSRIPPETLRAVGTNRDAVNYLCWRTYVLAQRGQPEPNLPPVLTSVFTRKTQPARIAEPAPAEVLRRNLEALGPQQCLFENRDFSVHYAKAREIPDLLQELGRLREITFRAAGEGTGRHTDLDRFDHC